jgi:serine protease Do
MSKIILKIIVVFIIGMAGGIFAERVFRPYFDQRSFYQSQIVGEQSPRFSPQEKKVVIKESAALKEAISKVERTVVGIKTKTQTGKIIYGSGIIVTSDGLMVTLAELLPLGSRSFAFFVDGKPQKYQVLKRDLRNNLALVKLKGVDFQTCSFGDFSNKLKLGEKVFLIETFFGKTGVFKGVNQGIIKFFNNQTFQTNIIENNNVSAKGSPIFNIKGELLGVSLIDSTGAVSAIPVVKIRDFIGF